MTTKDLAQKYVRKTEKAIAELGIVQSQKQPDRSSILAIVEEAKRYLQDAKYYLNEKRFETSLASVSYCEGLMEALRMLGFVEFHW